MRSIEEASLLRRSWQGQDIVTSGIPQLLQLPPGTSQTAQGWEASTTAVACKMQHASPCPTGYGHERTQRLVVRAPRLTTRYTTIYTTTTAVRPVKPTSKVNSRHASKTSTKSASKPGRTSSATASKKSGSAAFQALYVRISAMSDYIF